MENQMEIQLKVMAMELATKTPGIKSTELIGLAKEILAFLKGA